MPWSWDDTEYSIHPRLTTSWRVTLDTHHHMLTGKRSWSFSFASHHSLTAATSLWMNDQRYTQLGPYPWLWLTNPQNWVSAPIMFLNGLPPDRHTQKYYSNLVHLWPPREFATLLDHGLHVRTIEASKCIPQLTWSLPPISHEDELQAHLQTCLIEAWKFISKLTSLWPPGPSRCLFDHLLQVYLHP